MRRKRFAFWLVLVFLCYGIEAQESKPLIQLNPFFIEGIGVEESRLIVSLVQSYLSDIGKVVSHTVPGSLNQQPPDSAESGPKAASRYSADYTINGAIRMDPDGHVFLLEIMNTKTGETYTVSSVHKTTGELALKARSILESAFAARELEFEKKPSSIPERLSEQMVTGAWKGEAGIEAIYLLERGRGLAIFSSGAQMVLSYAIEKNGLKIWQISPNSERYYYPLPQHIARQLAQGAEPMVWELSLYQDGTLGGIKFATGIRLVSEELVELIPGGDVREVTWTRANH
jgi:hypothetical protein